MPSVRSLLFFFGLFSNTVLLFPSFFLFSFSLHLQIYLLIPKTKRRSWKFCSSRAGHRTRISSTLRTPGVARRAFTTFWPTPFATVEERWNARSAAMPVERSPMNRRKPSSKSSSACGFPNKAAAAIATAVRTTTATTELPERLLLLILLPQLQQATRKLLLPVRRLYRHHIVVTAEKCKCDGLPKKKTRQDRCAGVFTCYGDACVTGGRGSFLGGIMFH